MIRAAFACDPMQSRGRAFGALQTDGRSCFQHDRDRIIHATAFRRLQYKTQVFVTFESDHFRTRLTHSLEVAQIARAVARRLAIDEDLTEAVALAHDLGHSPFGHAGERALDEALRDHGGFDHNRQAFEVVTRLEQRYAGFDGLDLSAETLEGIVKHHGPFTGKPWSTLDRHPLRDELALSLRAPLEAQTAAIADEIAYVSHDLDDGLRADLFQLDDLQDLPVLGELVREILCLFPNTEPDRKGHEVSRRLINQLVGDLERETRNRLHAAQPATADDVRHASHDLVALSAPIAGALTRIRAFLQQRMYRHYKIARMNLTSHRLLGDLTRALLTAPDCLPDRWRATAGAAGSNATAIVVRDYVAGMTDRFALDEYDRLFRFNRDRL